MGAMEGDSDRANTKIAIIPAIKPIGKQNSNHHHLHSHSFIPHQTLPEKQHSSMNQQEKTQRIIW